MTERAYSSADFVEEAEKLRRLRDRITSPDDVLYAHWTRDIAALRIAARVMEPGVLEKAIRACVLGPENAELHPPMEYERNSANTIRSFLTKGTP